LGVLCFLDQVCHLFCIYVLHSEIALRDIDANYDVPEEILQEDMKSLDMLH